MATAVFGEGYAHTLWVAPTYVMGKKPELCTKTNFGRQRFCPFHTSYWKIKILKYRIYKFVKPRGSFPIKVCCHVKILLNCMGVGEAVPGKTLQMGYKLFGK